MTRSVAPIVYFSLAGVMVGCSDSHGPDGGADAGRSDGRIDGMTMSGPEACEDLRSWYVFEVTTRCGASVPEAEALFSEYVVSNCARIVLYNGDYFYSQCPPSLARRPCDELLHLERPDVSLPEPCLQLVIEE